jgi:hypothetical protein
MKNFFVAAVLCTISATSVMAGGPVEVQDDPEPMMLIHSGKDTSSEVGAKAANKVPVSDGAAPMGLAGGGGAGKATFKEFTAKNSQTGKSN